MANELLSIKKTFKMFCLSILIICLALSVCSVQVEAKPKAKYEAKINKSIYTLKKGKSVKLKVTKNKAAKKKKVVWTSSNKKVATVSSSGKVKAKKNGKAKITAKLKGTKVKVTCQIIVGTPVSSVSLSQQAVKIRVGEGFQLSAAVSPAKATTKKVTYQSSQPSVAAVSASGAVTGVNPGTAAITARAADGTGKSAVCTVTVEQGLVAVSSVTLSETVLSLAPGESKKITASVKPDNASDKSLTWSSSNEDVVTVGKDGTVKAVSEGTAAIKVLSANGVGAECSVKVAYPNVVGDQEGLEQAVKSKMLTKVIINSDSAGGFTVPSGDYTSKVLEINAPKAEVTNSGQFDKVVINAIAENTYTENANNVIDFNAKKGHIIVNEDAVATVNLSGANGQEVYLENNGHINDVNVPGKVSLRLEGKNVIPVTMKAEATDSVIVTSTELRITSDTSWNMTLLPGSENSKATVENSSCLPSVNGVGYIPVTVSEEEDIVNIMAQTEDNEEIRQRVNVEGKVLEYYLSDEAGTEEPPADSGNTDKTDKNKSDPAEDTGNENGENTEEPADTGTTESTDPAGDIANELQSEIPDETGTAPSDSDGGETSEKHAVSGNSKGANVYLLSYTKENNAVNEDNYKGYLGNVETISTDENGNYKFNNAKIGNYWLIIDKEGYKPLIKNIMITSNTTESYSCGTVSILSNEIAESEEAPEISGVITDSLTGKTVKAAGIQVKLRAGVGNIIGDVLKSAKTDENGAYSFKNISAGVYTIEAIDMRQDLSEDAIRYNAASTDIVVAYGHLPSDEYNCILDQQMQDIATGQGQVQFTLTWGNESSGASADIDSHLIGPKADGNGVFHVYYSDQEYRSGEDRMADLDVDDTDYEGPEHTTIYKETNGIYRFYIHNFTEWSTDENEERPRESDKLAESSVQVRVTIGERSYPFNCPNKKGNLWYVCDYNSMTHTIIPKNEMSDFLLDDTGLIGLSEKEQLEMVKERALEFAKTAKGYLCRFSDNTAKTEYADRIKTLESQIKETDEYSKVMELYNDLENLMYDLEGKEGYVDVSADNMITYNSDTIMDYDNEGVIKSCRKVITCAVSVGNELENLVVRNNDVDEETNEPLYDVTLSQTSEDPEYAYKIHIIHKASGLEQDIYVKVLGDQAAADILDKAASCGETLLVFEENELIQKDKQRLTAIISEAENIKSQEAYNDLVNEIQEIQLKYEEVSERLSVTTVNADGIEEWWTSHYDEDDNWLDGLEVLKLARNSTVTDTEILSKMSLGFENTEATYEILDSDREDYPKMIKVTDGTYTKKIYISVREYQDTEE